VKQLGVFPSDPRAAAAIRSLLGEGPTTASAEEIAWAFRRLLEEQAPLVCVFDDIQWGEETFLDLIEHVALLSSGAAILMLCMARPELVEHRASWPVTLRLEPLADDDVERLIGARVSSGLRAKIARAAGGNPLLVHEMLAIAGEAHGEVIVPPTLHALLAARLDQLDGPERGVLERGAVEGEVFHRGAVQALDPEAPVTPRLAALVRKALIRPDRPQLQGEDAFRFRHLLIRDVAYDSLPKGVRADLHERLASWLEEHGAELIELDEILGYHLEQACRYRAELGLPVDQKLRAAARRYLTVAGRRADLRQDYGAAVSLLERAASLVPEGELDLGLEVGLAEALMFAGRAASALTRAGTVAERAAALGDRVGELCGRTLQGIYRIFLEPEGATVALEHVVEQALPVFEASDDAVALFVGYYAVGEVANMRCQFDAVAEAFDRAAVYARRGGTSHGSRLLWRSAVARLAGTTPIPALLGWLDEQESQGVQAPPLKRCRAAALASLGEFDEAHTILAEHDADLADRGDQYMLALSRGHRGEEVELLAGDPRAAVRYGQESCRVLEEMGQRSVLSTVAGLLAGALCEVDRLDEAAAWARRAEELGASDDVETQVLWRQAWARVLARRENQTEAKQFGYEAIAIADTTDNLRLQGTAYMDLAEVLSLAGCPDEAADMLREALDRYDRKGMLVLAARTRERLQALQEGIAPS
jgi:tetratricopeptide (TPR) repeat protein